MIKSRRPSIPLVKVQWKGHPHEEATWEHELDVRNQYPSLNFEEKILLRGEECNDLQIQVSKFYSIVIILFR